MLNQKLSLKDRYKINENYLVYRYHNGIKLINPDYQRNKINERTDFSTIHTVANIFQLPFAVYLENHEHVSVLCNEITAEECGFSSLIDCLGKPWFKPFVRKSVVTTIKNDKEVVEKNTMKIVEEHAMRNDSTPIHTLSVRMPWYNDENKIVGLFGCSIVLGKHPIAESINYITQLGLLNIHNRTKNCSILLGSEIDNVYLSKQETECLYHYVRGKTAKEIAKITYLSHRTVENYIQNIKSKLNVSTKTELIYSTFNFFKNGCYENISK